MTGTRKNGRTVFRPSTRTSATRACRSAFLVSGAPVAIPRRTLSNSLPVILGPPSREPRIRLKPSANATTRPSFRDALSNVTPSMPT